MKGVYMRALMHIVLSSEDENIYQEVCHELKTFYPSLSISPQRDYFGMKDSSEFYVTFNINKEDIQELLDKLSNDFDVNEDEDSWECYGITSKVFNKNVYSIHLDTYE
jgi:hypothetical protein